MTRAPSRSAGVVAGLFGISGVLHLGMPGWYERIVPTVLPRKRAIVYASGVAELGCAVGLLNARTRRCSGLASAVLLVAVFPANVQMAVNAHRRGSRTLRAGSLLRLPLQLPLLRAALRAARGE